MWGEVLLQRIQRKDSLVEDGFLSCSLGKRDKLLVRMKLLWGARERVGKREEEEVGCVTGTSSHFFSLAKHIAFTWSASTSSGCCWRTAGQSGKEVEGSSRAIESHFSLLVQWPWGMSRP